MAEGLTIDASQMAVLTDFFNNLSTIDERKVLMAGLKRAAKPLQEEAKRLCPRRTGGLASSIGEFMLTDKIGIVVGPKKASKAGWKGHLLEYGTKERYRKK